MTKVFIDGSEGTTGLRIFERFEKRSDVELLKIDSNLRKDAKERARLINESDITFLCLPDAAARESVSLVENENVRIIDTSTAHRTEEGWAYGFAELSAAHRENIKNGKRIAVPGCHASGFIALAYPMVQSGIFDGSFPVTCFSLTGYSGGGKKMIASYEGDGKESELFSPRVYATTQNHKHLKEMQIISGLKCAPVFSPIVDDYYSGMLVTVPLDTSFLKKKVSLSDVQSILKEHYAESKMVRYTDMDSLSFIGSNNMSGLDYMEVSVVGNDDRMTLVSRFDNLGKGASGAAMQCMNIMLGLDESFGLNA